MWGTVRHSEAQWSTVRHSEAQWSQEGPSGAKRDPVEPREDPVEPRSQQWCHSGANESAVVPQWSHSGETVQ